MPRKSPSKMTDAELDAYIAGLEDSQVKRENESDDVQDQNFEGAWETKARRERERRRGERVPKGAKHKSTKSKKADKGGKSTGRGIGDPQPYRQNESEHSKRTHGKYGQYEYKKVVLPWEQVEPTIKGKDKARLKRGTRKH